MITLKKRAAERLSFFLSKSNGFTLIELIAIVVIMGILAAAAARPMIGTYFDRSNLSNASQIILSDIKTVRAKAMQTQKSQGIIFALQNTTYTFIEKDGSWVNGNSSYAIPSTIEIYSSNISDYKIMFNNNGQPFEGNGETAVVVTKNIVLRSGKGLEKTIYVLPQTGYIYDE